MTAPGRREGGSRDKNQSQRKSKKKKKRKASGKHDDSCNINDSQDPVASDEESQTLLSRGSSLSASPPSILTRDCSCLYTSPTTVKCALDRCVPCAYKVGCFDVALDQEFCRQVPNQRPEICPRAAAVGIGSSTGSTKPPMIRAKKNSHKENKQSSLSSLTGSRSDVKNTVLVENGVMGYCSGMRVLTCGDGDFSFSLGLARLFQESSSSTTIRLVATSYEDRGTLEKVYPGVEQTIAELERLGVTVCYKVDATRLHETLPSAPISVKRNSKNDAHGWLFHRICWNFPCTAIARGMDGQNREMEDNKKLVRQFVQQHVVTAPESMRHKKGLLLHPTEGEIHICHKTKPPYDQWKLERVALDRIEEINDTQTGNSDRTKSVRPAATLDLFFAGRIVLDRFLVPPYTPRKALDRKSFPCHDACFYIFGCRSQKQSDGTFGENNSVPEARTFPPTLPQQPDTQNPAHTGPSFAIPVTKELIMKIRSALLAEKSVAEPQQKAKKRKC